MKKVVVIFIALVCIFMFTSIALGDDYEEVINFLKSDNTLEIYTKCYDIQDYYIINGVAYAIGNIGQDYENMYDFMENYPKFLEEHWPSFAKDVNIDYTYTGETENYTLICVWLELTNGKTMHEYVSNEPKVTKMTAIIPISK